ncbi:hypothetical protein [Natronosalvus vescus]|uniref:hypothetical protein n=1 Tax=Natronosalvus vescus TaxID=2953881 RepID=UPI002091DC2E|nr:hypothetical protein [Natronosalvus vescus]
MAPAIVHFLVGASIVLLVATPFVSRTVYPTPWALWLVVIGGLWGLAPDVYHIAPVYRSELVAFHDSQWADLCAFHYTLDRPFVRARYVESIFGSILLFLGAVSVFSLATWRRSRLIAPETDAPASRT